MVSFSDTIHLVNASRMTVAITTDRLEIPATPTTFGVATSPAITTTVGAAARPTTPMNIAVATDMMTPTTVGAGTTRHSLIAVALLTTKIAPLAIANPITALVDLHVDTLLLLICERCFSSSTLGASPNRIAPP